MSNSPGADMVYEVAELFKQRCLIEGRSFLWPNQKIWNSENLRQLWDILMRSEAQSELSTLASIATAVRDESTHLHMILVDVLAAGCFFPATKSSTQLRYFHEFFDVLELPDRDPETWQRLESIFEIEVPGSFTHYKGGKMQNYFSALFGLMVIVEHDAASAGRDTLVSLIRSESADLPLFWAPLIWGMLHTMYQDEFVSVPGRADRAKIIKAFASQLEGKSFSNDFAALDYLRKTLTQPEDNAAFDFYGVDMLRKWDPRSNRIAWLTRNDATQPLPDVHPNGSIESQMVAEELSLSTLSSLTHISQARLTDIDELLLDKKQLIFEGPPGSGKTYVAEKFARWFTAQTLDAKTPLNEQVEIIQFHQSYGYEDFVQGIRPKTNEHGQLIYAVEKGIFREMCERASANDKEKKFVLIIDEINRGNLSRIFGELLLLLEYRGMSVRLPYGDKETLTIPENLYIIGTMNTADRSLAQIDYALRRRFYFVRFMPVENGRAEVYENWLLEQDDITATDRSRLLTMFIDLNEGISEKLNSADLQVGHSYFMQDNIETEAGLNRVWTRAVAPLLNEYLHHHRDRDDILAALTPASLSPNSISAAQEDDMPMDGASDNDGQPADHDQDL